MRRLTTCFLLTLILSACGSVAPPPVGVLPPPIVSGLPPTPTSSFPLKMVLFPRTHPGQFQSGVTLLLYGNDTNYPQEAPVLLNRLALDGVNSLAIAFPLYQSSRTANDIHIDPLFTPSSPELQWILLQAHARGFTTLLRPFLDEAALGPLPHWRGDIAPSNPTAWFTAYDSIMVTYAALATQAQVNTLDLGTELHSMESYASAWDSLVNNVRGVYKGDLTYSSNWSTTLSPALASHLAFVAVDAYYPLTAVVKPSQSQLIQAWQAKAIPDLLSRSRAAHKPLVISEIGIIPFDGVLATPWFWTSSMAYDPAIQANYYVAACAALKSSVAGLYWWQVGLTHPQPPHGGFDPLVIPATEQALKECYLA